MAAEAGTCSLRGSRTLGRGSGSIEFLLCFWGSKESAFCRTVARKAAVVVPVKGNGTCGTSGWRAGWGRGQAWGRLEAPRNPAFPVPRCASLLAQAQPGATAAALGGFPPHCGLAVVWVPGSSLRNLLFLMASHLLQCQELDLIFFFFLLRGETPLTWAVLPLPGQWVHWVCAQPLLWICGAWLRMACDAKGDAQSLPFSFLGGLLPWECALGADPSALLLGGTAPVSSGAGTTCDHQ